MLEQQMDEQYGARSGRYGLRPRRMPKYAGVPRAHLHVTVNKRSTIQPSGGGETWATAQVMMDKGLKMFGSDGLASVKSEMKQLHDRKVMRPRFKKELTPQQRAMSTEAVFLTAMIDALEDRDVAVIDIPGAFMQADMDDEVIIRFEGKMTELLIEVDEALYRPYAVMERGKWLYMWICSRLYTEHSRRPVYFGRSLLQL